MVWLKIDDGYTEHPKVCSLGKTAFWYHVDSMCYAARNLTDGRVPASRIPKKYARQLVEAGLLHVDGKSYILHDFLEYNPSRESVENAHEQKKEAGRKGGIARAKAQAGAKASAKAKPKQRPKQNSSPDPDPDPHASTKHEEPPKPPRGGRDLREDIDAVLAHYRTYHPRAKGDKKGRAKIADRLKDKFTVADLQQAIDGNHRSPWHCGQNPSGDHHNKVVTIFRDADQVNKFIEIAERPTQVPTNTRSARNMAVLSDWLKRGEASG